MDCLGVCSRKPAPYIIVVSAQLHLDPSCTVQCSQLSLGTSGSTVRAEGTLKSVTAPRWFYQTPQKKVQSNPKRFYRSPFWPPKRFHRTPVTRVSEPQKGFYRTFRIEPPPFQVTLLELSPLEGFFFAKMYVRLSWRYPEIGDRTKKVQSNPPKGSIEPIKSFYRTPEKALTNPFWPPKRFYRTLVRGASQPQTGLNLSHRTPPV